MKKILNLLAILIVAGVVWSVWGGDEAAAPEAEVVDAPVVEEVVVDESGDSADESGEAPVEATTGPVSADSENVTEENTSTDDSVVRAVGVYQMDTQASVLNWRGGKKIGGDHFGTIAFSGGGLDANGAAPLAHAVVDMNTMKVTDAPAALSHLKNADFFDVPNHPEARFELVSTQPLFTGESGTYTVTANLTIKGITNAVTFPLEVVVDSVDKVNVKGSFEIDRTKWDVNFGSESALGAVGNAIIRDEIAYEVNAVFVR